MKHINSYKIFENSEEDFFTQDIKNAFIEFIDYDYALFIEEDDEILVDITLPVKSDYKTFDELLKYNRQKLEHLEDINVAINRLKSAYPNLITILEYIGEEEIVIHFNIGEIESDFYKTCSKNNLIILYEEKLKKLLEIDDDRVVIRIYNSYNNFSFLVFNIIAPIGVREADIEREEYKLANKVKPLFEKLKIGQDDLLDKVEGNYGFVLNKKYSYLIQH